MSNSEISARLKLLRMHLNQNLSAFSRNVGIPRSTLVGYETGSTIPAELITEISRKYDISEAWLVSGFGELKKQPFDGKSFTPKGLNNSLIKNSDDIPYIKEETPNGFIIPYLDQPVSAGSGKELNTDIESSRFLAVPPELARYQNLSALPVRGDSMTPTLHEGDLVVCDSGGWDGDGVYVIKTAECAFVKRVVLTPAGFHVISDNKLYPSYSGSKEEIDIIGRVRCAVVKVE